MVAFSDLYPSQGSSKEKLQVPSRRTNQTLAGDSCLTKKQYKYDLRGGVCAFCKREEIEGGLGFSGKERNRVCVSVRVSE